jgi:aryl-alcohol dehydrogenase-like predicted oxidoreductase
MHKDYAGARFQRHLQAIDEIQALARQWALSCGQLCVGVLLHEPGLTGCIVGARNARQGALVANLGVTVTSEQAKAVWDIAARLQKDLEAIG